MGDPLSATTSILTLLSAAGAIGKFLGKVIALRQAPDILLALNNDIVDLHHVTQNVDDLLREHGGMIDKASHDHLRDLLERIKKTLSSLEQLVSYQLTAVGNDGGCPRLDRSVWLRAEPKVEKLRKQVRTDKGDLCLALTVLISSNSLQGVIRSRNLQTSFENLQNQVSHTARSIFDRLQILESSFHITSKWQEQQGISLHQVNENMEKELEDRRTLSGHAEAAGKLLREASDFQLTQAQQLESIQLNKVQHHEIDKRLSYQAKAIEAGLDNRHLQFKSARTSISKLPRFSSRDERSFQPSLNPCTTIYQARTCFSPRNGKFSRTMTMELAKTHCDSACKCTCHQRGRFTSPRCLEAILGSLFVGYQGLPWFTQACSNTDCRRRPRRLTYVYAFPQWFIGRRLLFDMSYSLSRGPELNLRLMRVRPDDTGIFLGLKLFGSSDDTMVYDIKRLYEKSEISVLDVNFNGDTILQRLLMDQDFDAVEFLIRCGADMYYQNAQGRSAFSLAWEIFLARPWLVEGETFLREWIWFQSEIDLLKFSELHKAYLGISGVNFSTALSVTPRSAIDRADGQGRTVLSWASEKGDDATLAQLLACGADPNIADSSGLSPLHYAANNSGEKCLRLLLASKAETEARNCWGTTPLNYAAIQGALGSIKALLEFGADVESQSYQGLRPIDHLTIHDHLQGVRQLLDSGADIFLEKCGWTTLYLAITNNSHFSLKVLLEAWEHSARTKDNVWSDVNLSQLAWYADRETLKIIHGAVLRGLHINFGIGDETDAVATAAWRRDNNQSWSEETFFSRDPDPKAWFRSFQRFLKAVKGNQSRIYEEDTNEQHSQSDYETESESSDVESLDESEGDEPWEDARES